MVIGRAAADLDRPGDAIGQRDHGVPSRRTEQPEWREARALADRQRAALMIEADGRRIVSARVLDVGLVERVAQVRAPLDIDRRPAVAEVEGCRGQTGQAVGKVGLPGAEVGGRCQGGIRHRRDHDQDRRTQPDQGGSLARQGVIENQLKSKDDEEQRPQVAEPQEYVGRENAHVCQQNDGADRDQQQRDQQAPNPIHGFLAAASQYQ